VYLIPHVTKTCMANMDTASLLVYLLGLLFTTNFVLIFIITILLLASDFYYLKNIAGRRLVGLRWWNEVDATSGASHWVFESAPQPNEPGGKVVNATDKRFFWLGLYAQPGLWVALAVVAVVRFEFIWLTLVGEYIYHLREIDEGLTRSSYCVGAYDYEYDGLLQMRQIQSGEWVVGEGVVLWVIGEECRRGVGFEAVQQWEMRPGYRAGPYQAWEFSVYL